MDDGSHDERESDIRLVRATYSDFPSRLRTNAQTLLANAFPECLDNRTDYYSNETPALILALHFSQRVVGHLAVYERWVQIGAEGLIVGMIGGVTIAPDYRGRGYVKVLVAAAHRYLAEKQIPSSILMAYEPLVYKSSGYRLMENETRFLGGNGIWRSLVYRGGMYAELLERRWPNSALMLNGPVV